MNYLKIKFVAIMKQILVEPDINCEDFKNNKNIVSTAYYNLFLFKKM